MKNKIVIFTPVGARIITAADPKPYKGQKNVLINPDLSKVKGVPPQYWERRGGEVREMSRPRKLARRQKIRYLGRLWQPKPKKLLIGVLMGVCGILGAALMWGTMTWLMR